MSQLGDLVGEVLAVDLLMVSLTHAAQFYG